MTPPETLPSTPPGLFWSMLVAVALAVYATLYGILLFILMFGTMQASGTSFLMVAAFFILAATPFIALVHLNRLRSAQADPPARPKIMAVVMCFPAAFWFYVTWDLLNPFWYRNLEDFLLSFASFTVPALLSLWLAVRFAWLGWRR